MLNKTSDYQTSSTSSVGSNQVATDFQPVMAGLAPAFRDTETGEIHLSRNADGGLSTDHSFFHLPKYWISFSNSSGETMALIASVEAGYWRSTGFIPIARRLQLPLDS